MNVLVTGANGQLGNEMRIVTKDSADKFVFTDVVDASEESIAMLKKLAGKDIQRLFTLILPILTQSVKS